MHTDEVLHNAQTLGTRLDLPFSAARPFSFLPQAGDVATAAPRYPPTRWLRPLWKRRSRRGATAGNPGRSRERSPRSRSTIRPWSQGDRLGSYEILKEDTSGAEKRFTVRLALAKPERVQEVQYYVLGRGPVMVFRDEDYMRNINMEDGPKLNKPGNSKAVRRR